MARKFSFNVYGDRPDAATKRIPRFASAGTNENISAGITLSSPSSVPSKSVAISFTIRILYLPAQTKSTLFPKDTLSPFSCFTTHKAFSLFNAMPKRRPLSGGINPYFRYILRENHCWTVAVFRERLTLWLYFATPIYIQKHIGINKNFRHLSSPV